MGGSITEVPLGCWSVGLGWCLAQGRKAGSLENYRLTYGPTVLDVQSKAVTVIKSLIV